MSPFYIPDPPRVTFTQCWTENENALRHFVHQQLIGNSCVHDEAGIVQEAMARIYPKFKVICVLHQRDPQAYPPAIFGKFLEYAKRTIRNLIVDKGRANRRERQRDNKLADQAPTEMRPIEGVEAEIDHRHRWQKIEERLTSHEYLAVRMKYEDYCTQEIAVALGVSPKTVQRLILSARTKLWDLFDR